MAAAAGPVAGLAADAAAPVEVGAPVALEGPVVVGPPGGLTAVAGRVAAGNVPLGNRELHTRRGGF